MLIFSEIAPISAAFSQTELIDFWKKPDDNLANKFEILDKGEWITLSDHLPLVFEFD